MRGRVIEAPHVIMCLRQNIAVLPTSTAPTGTSPACAAACASSSAICIKSSLINATLAWRARRVLQQCVIMEKKSQFEGDRIAKVLARAGVCSRRDAERMIADGRVAVNGRKLATPALNVMPSDHITVDGKPVGEPDPPPVALSQTGRSGDHQSRPARARYGFQKLPGQPAAR